MERFLSQLLPFLHGNTAAPSLLYGCDARQRGWSCFPPCAWHCPTGSGCSGGQAGALELGSIVLSWSCYREEGVGWEGAGVGESSTPPSPTWASYSSCQSRAWRPWPPRVVSALEPLGRTQKWQREGWDAHVLSPVPPSLWRKALAWGPYLVTSHQRGGSPQPPWLKLHLSPAGLRRARQGGGHAGPICSQPWERVQCGVGAARPLTGAD